MSGDEGFQKILDDDSVTGLIIALPTLAGQQASLCLTSLTEVAV